MQSDPRSRPRPFTFYSPKLNPLVIAVCKWITPMVIRNKLKVTRVEISAEDIAGLSALKGRRCLLLPSHSGGFEPHIIIYLSARLRESYNYLAAVETFTRSPLNAWFMRRIGAYSIIRGAADRPSFQMTRQLLVEGRRGLVIFPEGQTVWQNDTVIPFQQGVVQLAFKAYEEIVKGDAEASLPCVPIAVKYVYLKDMREEMAASLARLESRLFKPGDGVPGSLYQRLRRAGQAVLIANEKMHDAAPREGDSFDDRIQRMKETIVRRLEERLDITPRADQQLLERVRALFNAADRIVYDEDTGMSEYERKLLEERRQAARDLYDDLWRVLQFVAIYYGYVRENLTVERFMDVLCLLEMEVFGVRRIWGPRMAVVRVGEPLDLKDRFAAYRSDKRETARGVTVELESSVRDMLAGLAAAHGNPINLD